MPNQRSVMMRSLIACFFTYLGLSSASEAVFPTNTGAPIPNETGSTPRPTKGPRFHHREFKKRQNLNGYSRTDLGSLDPFFCGFFPLLATQDPFSDFSMREFLLRIFLVHRVVT
jgi:hypothetical protein